jgi:dihydrofolate reductase
MPHFDSETAALTGQVYQRADAFLFGRWTYEIFAGYWGAMADSDDPIAVALNTRPKYVASTTLTDPQWADTTVLSGDVAAAVSELKAKPGGELQVVGSLSLVRLLLDNDLVDELILLTAPVVVGRAPAVRVGHARPEARAVVPHRGAGRPQRPTKHDEGLGQPVGHLPLGWFVGGRVVVVERCRQRGSARRRSRTRAACRRRKASPSFRRRRPRASPARRGRG